MFKSSSFSLVLLTAALFCSGVSAQAPVASITSAQSSECLSVRGSRFHDGTAVEMDRCDGRMGQQWAFFKDGGPTEVKVAGLCIDAKTVDRPSEVVIWRCNGSPWQRWIFFGDGSIRLADNTRLCLEVPNSNAGNGAQVKTNGCNGAPNQIWDVLEE